MFLKPFPLGGPERQNGVLTPRSEAADSSFDGAGASSDTSKGHLIAPSRNLTTTRPTDAGANEKATASVSFAELGVPAPLTEHLEAEGMTNAFPIQQDTLPDTLAGRDVLGRGKTGSGKTLAFAIPMVTRLAASPSSGSRKGRPPRGLILAPTRELATQITNVVDPLAQAYGMATTTIFGGVKQKRQELALNAGVDIVVACPGRLEDLLQQGLVSLDHIEVTVLDEADHMADLGFLPGVTRILQKTPENGQRMFFSATLDNDVNKLVRRFLHNEVLHSVDDPNSHVSDMTHHVFEVPDDNKNELVHKLASGTGRRIMFTRTKHRAKRFARQLTAQGIPAVDLHGNLSQGARDRNLAAFSEGNVRVLVATDVAARGVHVDSVELVVHVDPPTEHKAYLHRSGRTARAGSSGEVVTIMLPEQRRDTQTLLRKADIKVTSQKVTADSPAVTELVGEAAAYVDPQIAIQAAAEKQKAEQPQSGQRSSGRRRGGRSGRNGRSGESNRANQSGGASGGRSQEGRSRSKAQGSRGGRSSESTQGGRRNESARGGRRNESTRGGRRNESSRTNGGNRRAAETRGTSPETRNRNRSRDGAGSSRTVYSTSS